MAWLRLSFPSSSDFIHSVVADFENQVTFFKQTRIFCIKLKFNTRLSTLFIPKRSHLNYKISIQISQMITFISFLIFLLATSALSNSQYIPTFSRCPFDARQIWFPQTANVIQNPKLKEVITISACGYIFRGGYSNDFRSLFVNGSVGSAYTFNVTAPYKYTVEFGERFCLNFTSYIPDLNEKSVNVTLHALDDYGEIGCVNIGLQNQTVTSI